VYDFKRSHHITSLTSSNATLRYLILLYQDDAYTEIRDSLRAQRKKNNENKNKPEASALQRQDSKVQSRPLIVSASRNNLNQPKP
jgi:hypothetical protein